MRLPRGALPITPALVCLLFANLADGILTLVLLQFHGANERNPIVARAYQISPLAFMATKICLVHGFLLMIALLPNYQVLKQRLIRFVLLLYLGSIAYQCILLTR